MKQYQDAIASIESAGSGDYAAVGPTHSKLGRALGRYQIMEANIGPWSRQALGREITPDEFMQSPELQDAIFNNRFGQYVDRFGPEGAAQAWFGGAGGVGKLNRSDSLGTTIGDYTEKFRRAIGSTSQPPPENALSQLSQAAPPPENALSQQSAAAQGPQIQDTRLDVRNFLMPQQQANYRRFT